MRQNQLPLDFSLEQDFTFDNFKEFDAASPIELLKSHYMSDMTGLLLFASERPSGKTHLLQACIEDANNAGISGIYICLEELVNFLDSSNTTYPDFLDLFVHQRLICIDNLQAIELISGELRVWLEEQCFALLNRFLLDAPYSILLASNKAVDDINIELPDLRSRLALAQQYPLLNYDDSKLVDILRFRSDRLGLEMPLDVAQFIIRRSSRELHSLLKQLDSLDRFALANSRRLTIPLVKEALGV